MEQVTAIMALYTVSVGVVLKMRGFVEDNKIYGNLISKTWPDVVPTYNVPLPESLIVVIE